MLVVDNPTHAVEQAESKDGQPILPMEAAVVPKCQMVSLANRKKRRAAAGSATVGIDAVRVSLPPEMDPDMSDQIEAQKS